MGDPCDVNNDGVIDRADLHQVNGKNGVTIDADGPGKGQAEGQGQQVACVATCIGADANQGQGKGLEKKRQSGNSQRLFAYDEHRLLGEYGPRGSVRQETVWLGNLPVATIQNGNTYYIHADHLGTPRVITDIDNTEVWRWDSDPFGTTAANEDPDGDGRLFAYNLRFPGQYFDQETGLHYNYFRDYDPGTGRYIESDPIGMAGGLNTYAYVSSNPILLVDPTGEVEWNGTQVEVGAAIGVGASFTRLKLTSECVNGKKGIATVWAVGPSIGIGAGGASPVSGSTNASFEDNLETPDPNVFNGVYSGYYAGVDYGPGRLGLQITVLGHAHAVGPTVSYGFGIAAGYIYTLLVVLR